MHEHSVSFTLEELEALAAHLHRTGATEPYARRGVESDALASAHSKISVRRGWAAAEQAAADVAGVEPGLADPSVAE